jgi:hypothetical protein
VTLERFKLKFRACRKPCHASLGGGADRAGHRLRGASHRCAEPASCLPCSQVRALKRPVGGPAAAGLRLSKGTLKPERPRISPGVSSNPGSAGSEGPLTPSDSEAGIPEICLRLRVVKRLFKPATQAGQRDGASGGSLGHELVINVRSVSPL